MSVGPTAAPRSSGFTRQFERCCWLGPQVELAVAKSVLQRDQVVGLLRSMAGFCVVDPELPIALNEGKQTPTVFLIDQSVRFIDNQLTEEASAIVEDLSVNLAGGLLPNAFLVLPPQFDLTGGIRVELGCAGDVQVA